MTQPSDRVLALAGERPLPCCVLLEEVQEFISRFCVFPDDRCLTAVTLWAAHTHFIEHFHTTPRLALLSPDPGSGKSRVFEILNLLVSKSMLSINASTAAVFRCIDREQITLLFDEVDAIWKGRGRDDNHEDLRSLINAGYRRGATVPRCVGPNHEVKNFSVFGALALAGLGELPDTIMSRSIIIKMRRRAPHEEIEQFRSRIEEPIGTALCQRLAEWADELADGVVQVWPTMPEGIIDRNAEIWEPLLAVAEAAGGEWPANARQACVALCKIAEDRRVSLGIRLLGDLRKIFGEYKAMSTKSILDVLVSGDSGLDDDAPWTCLRGHPIDSRQLASILKPYGIKSRKVKIDGISLRGYRREDFWDSWQRYLAPEESAEAEPTEPPERPTQMQLSSESPVPQVPEVPDIKSGEGSCLRCDSEGCGWCT